MGKEVCGLCTLPPAHFIQDKLEKLRWEIAAHLSHSVKIKMETFEAYFIRHWIVQKTLMGFPMFGLHHGTNNSVESLHSQMQRSMSTHPSLWRFLEELINIVIVPTKVVVKQINKGHNPREPMRRARLLRAELQNSYEDKLTNNEWTQTK